MRGGNVGTRCVCSRPPATTASMACRFRPRPTHSRRRTRWPTISRHYAAHFQLPVRNGVRVNRLSREGDRYLVEAGALEFEAPTSWSRWRAIRAGRSRLRQRVVARDRSASLQRVQVAVAAEARRRAGGGHRQLGRGDRDGNRVDASDVDLGPRRRLGSVLHREFLGPAHRPADSLPRRVSPHPHGEDADGTKGARRR